MHVERFVFSPIAVNSYILSDESGECAVIDCGCYDEAEFATLENYIESSGLKPVLLLNTHCHLDHIFGNGMFLKRYGLKTRACREEEANRNNSINHAMLYGLEMEPPPDIGEYVGDGEELSFGNTTLEAIFVPGHSPGSISWYCREQGVLFTGDALFQGGIGRTDLPGGDYDQLIGNIKNRLLTLPPDTLIYPGHGDSTTVEREVRENPWLI